MSRSTSRDDSISFADGYAPMKSVHPGTQAPQSKGRYSQLRENDDIEPLKAADGSTVFLDPDGKRILPAAPPPSGPTAVATRPAEIRPQGSAPKGAKRAPQKDSEDLAEGGPKPVRRSLLMRMYGRFCYFTPLGAMIFLIVFFAIMVRKRHEAARGFTSIILNPNAVPAGACLTHSSCAWPSATTTVLLPWPSSPSMWCTMPGTPAAYQRSLALGLWPRKDLGAWALTVAPLPPPPLPPRLN